MLRSTKLGLIIRVSCVSNLRAQPSIEVVQHRPIQGMTGLIFVVRQRYAEFLQHLSGLAGEMYAQLVILDAMADESLRLTQRSKHWAGKPNTI